PITDDFVYRMRKGVPILGTMTKECYVKRLNDKKFKIILTQGLNRQIRRMCEYFDYKVVTLKRVRIMNIKLADLKVGKWRDLTKEELRVLRDDLV
ncbi:MAG: 23S rRNA pseudouridine synthase F, partial [Saprospiraceae bacterium]